MSFAEMVSLYLTALLFEWGIDLIVLVQQVYEFLR